MISTILARLQYHDALRRHFSSKVVCAWSIAMYLTLTDASTQWKGRIEHFEKKSED